MKAENPGTETVRAENANLQKTEISLHEGEDRFRHLADTAPAMIWMAGANKACTYFNKGWLEFTGRTLEQELDDRWAEGVHAEDLPRCLETYSAAFETRHGFRMEYRLRRFDGVYRWILDHGAPRFLPDGSLAGYIGSCIDITERKQSERALQKAHEELEQRVHERTAQLLETNLSLAREIAEREQVEQKLAHFRTLMDHVDDAIFIIDPGTGGILDANETACRSLQYSRQELLALQVQEVEIKQPLHSPEDWAAAMQKLRAAGGFAAPRESLLGRKDGSAFPVDVAVSLQSINETSYLVAVARNITERKQAQESQEKLRQRNIRAAAIAEAEENERRRIARELHDGLGQILTGIKFNFETFERRLGALNRDERQRFAELKELLNNAIVEVQRISHNLTPRTLDDFGLVPALEFLCRQVAQHCGVKVGFGAHNLAERLSANLETGLFRIAQEALNNIAKHAGAEIANVKIARQASTVMLCIEDDGKGFRYEHNPYAGRRENGMGIINMRERVEALNGALTIESQSGQGTKIVIVLPQN